ncbi:MAG: 50S ribosomal protein L29 [Simkaniaceae bacterium]|nr:50S ribosomal protein L29 [Simkaniaceae bacterium]
MKYNEIKNDDLMIHLEEINKTIFQLQCELKATRKLQQPHLLRSKKKDRARILTAARRNNGAQ